MSAGPLFYGTLNATHIRGSEWWRLNTPLQFCTRCGTTLTVPPGFSTDFMSIPALLRPLLARHGRYAEAAVIHDHCYATGHYPRHRADAWLIEGLASLGASWITRALVFAGVRLGGWWRWQQLRSKA